MILSQKIKLHALKALADSALNEIYANDPDAIYTVQRLFFNAARKASRVKNGALPVQIENWLTDFISK